MPFEINSPAGKLVVQRFAVSGNTIYKIDFPLSRKKKSLILSRTLHANVAKFWTCIPKRRQKEAEIFGPLIADYLKGLRKSALFQ